MLVHPFTHACMVWFAFFDLGRIFVSLPHFLVKKKIERNERSDKYYVHFHVVPCIPTHRRVDFGSAQESEILDHRKNIKAQALQVPLLASLDDKNTRPYL